MTLKVFDVASSSLHFGTTTANGIVRFEKTNRDVTIYLVHTCDIFLEPDREIWDSSEGDWGLR